MNKQSPILPGATIGILGGGQLGKMTAIAATQMGYRTAIFAVQGDNPAMDLATYRITVPNWNDSDGIANLITTCDVVTTEWENAPISLIKELERQGVIVRPGSRVLEVAQSRFREKAMAGLLGIPTTKTVLLPAGALNEEDDWTPYLPGILKTDGLGYDGKGQFPVTTVEELVSAHRQANVNCVLEKRVDLAYEISVLVARTADGRLSVSDVVENSHVQGILDRTIWPGRIAGFSRSKRAEAQLHAEEVAKHLELEGILCLEFFVDKEGVVLFNEMAPRPHNSFHSSIEAAYTSQFEQQVRAVCGLPLGNVEFHTRFEMKNLIGSTWSKDWALHLVDPHARLHLYGKIESRPGRKMGHVTRLYR